MSSVLWSVPPNSAALEAGTPGTWASLCCLGADPRSPLPQAPVTLPLQALTYRKTAGAGLLPCSSGRARPCPEARGKSTGRILHKHTPNRPCLDLWPRLGSLAFLCSLPLPPLQEGTRVSNPAAPLRDACLLPSEAFGPKAGPACSLDRFPGLCPVSGIGVLGITFKSSQLPATAKENRTPGARDLLQGRGPGPHCLCFWDPVRTGTGVLPS